jgi:PAS domain S-box-containing protein
LEEIIGKKDEELFPEEIAVETSADDRRVIETGIPLVDKEEGGESIGGEAHWVLTTKLPWRDEKGNIIGLFGISKEITARKRMEHSLQESELKFRNLADQSPNMIFINQGGRVVYVNQKCGELGYESDEFYAADFDFLKLIAPEYKQLIEKNFRRHIAGEEVDPYEYALITKTGERKEVIITTRLIEFEGESAILGIVTDITERKDAEKSLLAKDEKLKRQARNLQEMNIALKTLLEHREQEKLELKENLLESIKKLVYPYIDKLQSQNLNEESQLYLSIIHSNLKDIIAPVGSTLSSKYLGLTPSEIQVVDLIKQGMTSKQIASTLHVSAKAVSFHRGNIRKKLGLQNKKVNLYSYLQSFPDRN